MKAKPKHKRSNEEESGWEEPWIGFWSWIPLFSFCQCLLAIIAISGLILGIFSIARVNSSETIIISKPTTVVQIYNNTVVRIYNNTIVEVFNTTIINTVVDHFNTTIIQMFNTTILEIFNTTIIDHYNTTIVYVYNVTVVEVLNTTIVNIYNTTIIQIFNGTIQVFNFTISSEIVSYPNTVLSSIGISFIKNDIIAPTVTLPDPPVATLKYVELLDYHGLDATVVTSSGAAFILSPDQPSRLLFFSRQFNNSQNKWKTMDTTTSFSMFPTIEQTRIIPPNAIGAFPNFGFAISLNNDGNLLAVGAPIDNTFIGATWVYSWTKLAGWTQMAKIIVPDGGGTPQVGYSCELSASGNTLVMGGPDDNNIHGGAAWVYILVGSTWTYQQKLIAHDNIGIPEQGLSVSISADGLTIAVGGPNDNSTIGATWIWVYNSTMWVEQAKLIGTGYSGTPHQGSNNKLSADGNTVAVSGVVDGAGFIGAVWVFQRTVYGPNNGTWSQMGSKLVGTNYIGGANQGTGLDMNADGTLIAVGGPGDNSFAGAVWIFELVNGLWTQLGNKILPQDNAGQPNFGTSLAVSASGTSLFVGGFDGFTFDGGMRIFLKTLDEYKQIGSLIAPANTTSEPFCGTYMASNGDGSVVALGCTSDEVTGTVSIFV
jgi:hypothetical protein